MAKRRNKQEGAKPVDDEAEARRKEEKMARRELNFRRSHLMPFIIFIIHSYPYFSQGSG